MSTYIMRTWAITVILQKKEIKIYLDMSCHVLFLPLTNIQVICRYVGIPRARILKHPSVKQQFGHIARYNSMSWVK